MKEEILHKYFKGQVTDNELVEDLKGSQERTGYDTINVYIESIAEGGFQVKTKHLEKLCDAFLNKIINSENLNTIGFALMASDFFEWDTNTKSGKIIGEVISDWDNTSIGYEITDKNVWHWQRYLETGFNNLDKNEIKYKIRSKGKYLNLYRQIDLILEKEWDPIGVSEIVRDEYQMYVPQIFKMKQNKSSGEEIGKVLYKLETEKMGLLGNRENCKRVGEMINKIEMNSDT